MATRIDIKVLSTTAMKTVFEELAPEFERATGHRLDVTLGPSLRLEKQLGEGEPADVAIVQPPARRDLAGRGKLVPGSISRSRQIVDRRCGAKGCAEAGPLFGRRLQARDACRKVDRVSKPVGGGQSGVHIAKVFADLGIAEAMAAKAKYGAGGAAGSLASSCCAARPTSAFSRWRS